MAFVSGFKNDIFISYAHQNDEPDPDGHRWITRFKIDLGTALTQRLGQSPEIFLDNAKLDAVNHLSVLLENARESFIFVPVLSPGYVKRQWTIQELEAFCQETRHDARIAAVELLPLHLEDDLPAQLQNLKRTHFWWKDEAKGSTAYKLTPKRPDYSTAVDDLAECLANQLREGRKRRDGIGADLEPKLNKTVLLAHVTEDLEDDLNQLRRYLESYFERVLPETDYPQGGAEFAKAFEANLDKSDIFVQLLGNVAARRLLDMPQGYAQYQYAAAMKSAQAGKKLRVLQWRRNDLDISKVTHRDRDLLNGSVMASGLGELKRAIVELGKDPKPQVDKGDFLFLNFDKVDQDIADRLLTMFKAKNQSVFPSLFKGTAQEIDEDRNENLMNCSSLVLVYGQASPRWVRAQIRCCSKVSSARSARGEPLDKRIILLAPPPPKNESAEIGVVDFGSFDCQDDASVERLHGIIEELCP